MSTLLNENLDEILTCKICKKYYLNPIILPCSNNVCIDHVNQKTIGKNTRIFQCDLCFFNHELPHDGFILNRSLIDILNLNIHLDEKAKLAIKSLDDLDTVNKEINMLARDPESFIYSYFFNVKNKIDLKREKIISKLHDISDDILNKIKLLEIDCKSNLEEVKNLIDLSQFDFQKLTELSKTWREELRTPKLSQDRLDVLLNDANSLLKENETKSFEAKNQALKGKGCHFIVNNSQIKSEFFGELVIDSFKNVNRIEKYGYIDSNILTQLQSFVFYEFCEIEPKQEYKLLYRASRDGFGSDIFHSKCNGIAKTLTIIKVKDKPHIFGGYCEAIWDSSTSYKLDKNSFLFSLVNNDNMPIKLKINQNVSNAIYSHPSYGPTFGGGHDFYISSASNNNAASYSNLGHTYVHPNYRNGTNEAKNFLAGSYNFSTSEIEVYQVI